MGDVVKNPDTQAQGAPPSLRNPGEALPTDNNKDSRVGVMKPVQFPKQKPEDDGTGTTDPQQGNSGSAGQTPAAAAPAPGTPAANPPQPAPAKPDPDGSQQR
jgi:hypothetical protein